MIKLNTPLAAAMALAPMLTIVTPQVSHAGDGATSTCAQLASNPRVASIIRVSLNAGDTINASSNFVQGQQITTSATLAKPASAQAAAPVKAMVVQTKGVRSFVAPADGVYIFSVVSNVTYLNQGSKQTAAELLTHNPKKTRNIATFTCVPALEEKVPETTQTFSDEISEVTRVLNNARRQSIGGGVSQAVGTSFGDGDTSGFISQNGFSVSSKGLAALAQRAKAKEDDLSLNGKASNGVYGSSVNLNNLAEDTKWNFWARGRYMHFDGNNNSFNGGVGNINAGVDYRLNEKLLVGAFVGYGNSDFSVRTNSSLRSDAYSVGGYFGARVNETVGLDGFVAYTRSDFRSNNAGATGSFNSDSIAFGGNLYGTYKLESITIEPRVSFVYGIEEQASFTDSAATLNPSQRFDGGRISVGPKFIFDALAGGENNIRPWFAPKYEYDFSDTRTSGVTGTKVSANSSSARLIAGIDAQVGSGILQLSAEVGGLGSGDFVSYGGTAKIRMPF